MGMADRAVIQYIAWASASSVIPHTSHTPARHPPHTAARAWCCRSWGSSEISTLPPSAHHAKKTKIYGAQKTTALLLRLGRLAGPASLSSLSKTILAVTPVVV